MRYYFAPMEGLTDSVYRRVHHTYFPGVDRYYTPFISPTIHQSLTQKEKREIPRADTLDYQVVPQILTKNAEDFLWLAQQCRDLGYEEVNLNLGCPSGTVTAKGKGSGMLRDVENLDRFLETIFCDRPLEISVKTRLGFDSSEEFPGILTVLNRYPIRELIIHPRVRNAFYKGKVEMESFAHAVKTSPLPLCYNGDIASLEQIGTLQQAYPQVESVMIGRGLIGDPGMVTPGGTTREALEGFCDDLLQAYTEAFGSARNALPRLKENWRYLSRRFVGSEKLWKRLRKTTDIREFTAITHEIFATLPLADALDPDW